MAAEKRIYTNLTRAFIIPDRVRRLNLSGKGMRTGHPNILRLSHLHHLNLNHNQLETVPVAVCDRTGLEEQLLQDSRIEQLPEAIDSFPDLRELYLQNNSINRFLASLVRMNKREVRIVRGNLNAPESRHRRESALPQTWIGWMGDRSGFWSHAGEIRAIFKSALSRSLTFLMKRFKLSLARQTFGSGQA